MKRRGKARQEDIDFFEMLVEKLKRNEPVPYICAAVKDNGKVELGCDFDGLNMQEQADLIDLLAFETLAGVFMLFAGYGVHFDYFLQFIKNNKPQFLEAASKRMNREVN